MKRFTIRPRSPQYDIPEPKPASLEMAEWYRKLPAVNEEVLTAKRCVPMLDAFTAGYTIVLAADVHWDPERGEVPYWVDSEIDVVSRHYAAQTEGFGLGEEFNPQPFKWTNHWHVETPKGYSTWFTQPVNRTDLPFYSFTGFVDTDAHPLIINFPFAIKKDFKGIIPAGTPIIQAIPIRREDWQLEFKDTDKPHRFVKEYEVMTPPFAWYKRKYWHKKKFQ